MEGQYIVFKIEAEEYAVDILKVKEVNRLKEISITKIANTPDYIVGIINLRGEIVPVLNLRRKFSLSAIEISKQARIIVVHTEDKLVGLLVDSVSKVVFLSESEISPPPDEVVYGIEFVIGVGKKDNRMFFILDADRVISAKEKAELSL